MKSTVSSETPMCRYQTELFAGDLLMPDSRPEYQGKGLTSMRNSERNDLVGQRVILAGVKMTGRKFYGAMKLKSHYSAVTVCDM